MLRDLLVAVDGSKPSVKAFELALELAKAFSSNLTILSVAPIRIVPSANLTALPVMHETDVSIHRDLLESFRKQAKELGMGHIETVLLDGFVAEEILNYLDGHPFDLVLMGARGLSGTARFFLGSVSDAVVRHAKCPVLVVRG